MIYIITWYLIGLLFSLYGMFSNFKRITVGDLVVGCFLGILGPALIIILLDKLIGKGPVVFKRKY